MGLFFWRLHIPYIQFKQLNSATRAPSQVTGDLRRTGSPHSTTKGTAAHRNDAGQNASYAGVHICLSGLSVSYVNLIISISFIKLHSVEPLRDHGAFWRNIKGRHNKKRKTRQQACRQACRQSERKTRQAARKSTSTQFNNMDLKK